MSLFHDQQILQWPTVCRKDNFMCVPDERAGRQRLWEQIRAHLKGINQQLCIRILQKYRAMEFRLGLIFVFLSSPALAVASGSFEVLLLCDWLRVRSHMCNDFKDVKKAGLTFRSFSAYFSTSKPALSACNTRP